LSGFWHLFSLLGQFLTGAIARCVAERLTLLFKQVRSLVFIWCDRLQDLPQKKINLTAA